MRVICLVPSLTETLIECGVNVVGRTRFCIHPAAHVADIVKVGGTKGVDWARCAQLKPDILVFDREENIKAMAEECPYAWAATHITSVDNIGDELITLAKTLQSSALQQLGLNWQALAVRGNLPFPGWHRIPGTLATLNNTQSNYQRLEYVIWREPWMAIGNDTFIDSMLRKLGFADYLPNHSQAYPEIDMDEASKQDVFYLFSSEPFPFARHKETLIDQGYNGSVVDGELYSWFGIRSYRALLQAMTNDP